MPPARAARWRLRLNPLRDPLRPERRSRKRILTIDNSKTMRDMLMLTLSSNGFEVLQAVDGLDGIDVLGRETVDVVITDINMPKLDGYGVIQHMREQRGIRRSADPGADHRKRQREEGTRTKLGATGFIIKPFNPDRIGRRARKVAA